MSGVKLGGLSFSFSANTAEYDRAMARIESAENRLAALQTSQNKEREREAAQIARLNEQIERARERSNELEAAAQSASIAKQKVIRQQLASIGAQIERNEAAIASLKKTAATNENARLAALDKMQKKVDAAKARAEKLAKAWTRVKGAISGVGGALVGMVGVAGIKKLIDDLDALAKRARDVGMTASQLQEFSHQAKLAGMSAGGLDSAIKTFNRNISLATMGTGEAQAALKNMGISLTTSNGAIKTQAQLLKETAQYFQRNAGAADNAGKAARIFGEQGTALIRIFEQGGDAIDKIFNANSIDTAAAAAERFNDSLENVKNLAFEIGAQSITGFSDMIDHITDVFKLQELGTQRHRRELDRLNEDTRKWRAMQAANERAAQEARLAAEKKYNDALKEEQDYLRGNLSIQEQYKLITQRIGYLTRDIHNEESDTKAAELVRERIKAMREQARIKEQILRQEREQKRIESELNGLLAELNGLLAEQQNIFDGELSTAQKYENVINNIASLTERLGKAGNMAESVEITKQLNAALKEQASLKKQMTDAQKNQSDARAEFEMQTRLQILRAQGKDKEADAIEFARRRNELMDKYGYSIQQATAAQKTLDELNKAKEGGGDTQFSDAAKKRAQKIVDRGIGGTVGKKTYEEAQAILAGKTPEAGFTTSMFSRLTADSKRSGASLKNINIDAKAARSQLDTEAQNIQKRNGENADATTKLLEDLNSTVLIIKNTVSGLATKDNFNDEQS